MPIDREKPEVIPLVDVAKHVRRNAQMYFGSRGPNPEHIASAIAQGALILGARRTMVTDEEGWWYVCADSDWLNAATIVEVDERSIFRTIFAFPEAGVNWNRSEAMARVFSDHTFSVAGSEVYRVVGNAPSDEQILRRVSELGTWARVIGFHFTNAA